MRRKILTGFAAAAAFYLLPSVGNTAVLSHPQLWILIATALAVSAFQPAYRPFDRSAPKHDRGTATQIVWSVYVTQFVGIIEAIYFRYPDSFQWDAATTAGLIAIIGGLALRTWAVLTLGRYFTWFITVYEDHKVIRIGPFRMIRHPAYCGAWVLFVGTMVFLHAWIGAALSLVFQLFAYVRRIHYEEAMMVEKLGDSYKQYIREVRALVPLLW